MFRSGDELRFEFDGNNYGSATGMFVIGLEIARGMKLEPIEETNEW